MHRPTSHVGRHRYPARQRGRPRAPPPRTCGSRRSLACISLATTEASRPPSREWSRPDVFGQTPSTDTPRRQSCIPHETRHVARYSDDATPVAKLTAHAGKALHDNDIADLPCGALTRDAALPCDYRRVQRGVKGCVAYTYSGSVLPTNGGSLIVTTSISDLYRPAAGAEVPQVSAAQATLPGPSVSRRSRRCSTTGSSQCSHPAPNRLAMDAAVPERPEPPGTSSPSGGQVMSKEVIGIPQWSATLPVVTRGRPAGPEKVRRTCTPCSPLSAKSPHC